jgi:hypothetical protein
MRESKTMSGFSSYAAFLDAMSDARVASFTIILNQEKPGNYWTEFGGALDQRASSKTRLDHARSAIKVESEVIDGRFDTFNSALENLDHAVGQLVETANSVETGSTGKMQSPYRNGREKSTLTTRRSIGYTARALATGVTF